jgi:hypothetical protein
MVCSLLLILHDGILPLDLEQDDLNLGCQCWCSKPHTSKGT